MARQPPEFHYPASAFWLTAVSGLVLSGLFIGFAVWAYADPEWRGDWLWALIAASATVWSICASISVKLSSIGLHKDRIEHRGLFRRRELLLSDIAGWRPGEGGNITLERRNGKHDITLPKALVLDPRWQDWLDGLTDLEAAEANAQFDAVQADSRLGNTAAQRVETANRAKRLARYASLAMVAVAIWGFAFPRPYPYAMLANGLAPIVALFVAWRWSDLFTLDGAEAARGGKGALSFLLLWPGPVLAIRVMSDFDMLDWMGPILAGLFGCALAGLAAVRLHQYGRPMMVWLFVSLFGWAGFGPRRLRFSHGIAAAGIRRLCRHSSRPVRLAVCLRRAVPGRLMTPAVTPDATRSGLSWAEPFQV